MYSCFSVQETISDLQSCCFFVVFSDSPDGVSQSYLRRNLKRMNADVFKSRVLNSDCWLNPAPSVDDYAEQIRHDITKILDDLAPERLVKRRKSIKRRTWLSDAAIEAKRKRRRLERKWRKSGLDSDRVRYRSSCRETNKLINESLASSHAKTIQEASHNPRSLWRAVNSILHPPSSSETISPEDVNASQCGIISKYFQDKLIRIRDCIKNKLASMPHRLLPVSPRHVGSTLSECEPVTAEEVIGILNNMPCKFSPVDYIPTTLLKQFPEIFGVLIARLASISFSEGRFPTMFKRAQITPLLKKPGADPTEPSNYRPISNLNTISKILEKLFMSRILPALNDSVNFCKLQSAYRRRHSTETALLKIFNDCFGVMDRQQGTVLITLDISAAFDTISHTILLDRLETCFGVTGSVLKWVESYLTNRSQFVKIGGSASQDTFLSAGVPQGSVLGPLLFCSYVSSLQTVVPDGILFHQYADDTQLYCSVSTNNFLADVGALQNCTDVIEYWFLTNEMLLNADKSDALLVSTSQQANKLQPDARVMVAGTSVALSDSVRSLGVVIDKHLSMEKHINSVLSSCCFHIKALRHIRRCLTDEVANTVARCIVLSRIDYCNSLLYGAPS